MASPGSVSAWIGQLREGEESALLRLHARYWPWLVEVARRKMKGARLRAADEEDVAQQAFWSFYNAFKEDGLPRLRTREDLLALLTTIAACKAVNLIQHEVGVQRRGAGRVQSESALPIPADASVVGGNADQVAAVEYTPQEAAILNDCYRYFVDGLPDKLREFAELHLAGYTHREIAGRMGCAERTVERKLALVLARWQEMAVHSVTETG